MARITSSSTTFTAVSSGLVLNDHRRFLRQWRRECALESVSERVACPGPLPHFLLGLPLRRNWDWFAVIRCTPICWRRVTFSRSSGGGSAEERKDAKRVERPDDHGRRLSTGPRRGSTSVHLKRVVPSPGLVSSHCGTPSPARRLGCASGAVALRSGQRFGERGASEGAWLWAGERCPCACSVSQKLRRSAPDANGGRFSHGFTHVLSGLGVLELPVNGSTES